MKLIGNGMKTSIREVMRKPFIPGANKGMSLIEILIVIALLGTVMTILIQNLTGSQEQAMRDAARLSMQQLQSSLQMYKVHNYRFPKTDEGLDALVIKPSNSRRWRGPYTEKSKLKDPWGTEFGYESDGRTFKIISAGPSADLGFEEDNVYYPDEEEEADES